MYLLYLTMKTPNGIFTLCILLYALITAVICPRLIKNGKTAHAYLLCSLPLIGAGIHFGIYGRVTLELFQYMYIAAALPVINLLPARGRRLPVLWSVISALSVTAVCAVSMLNIMHTPMVHNYKRLSYTESFVKMLDTMEKEYCLVSWKNIDMDAMKEEYLPIVEAAEKNGDEEAYAAVIAEVAYRLYDWHVIVDLSDEDGFAQHVSDSLSGNDYGFSMVRLDDGSVIAVMADEDAAGIHNGTRITAWDGQDIDEAINDTECILTSVAYPVKSNEDMYRPMFLAGKGGDSVRVTYTDDSGEENTVSIDKKGSYRKRLRAAIAKFDHSTDRKASRRNNYACMIDDRCGYLQVTKEHFDDIKDYIALADKGRYPALTEHYAKLIEGLRAQGMEYLVIDIRNNRGGFDCCAGALVSLFCDEKRPLVAFGYEDSEGYHIKEQQYIFPDGRYKDIPVAVLVNDSCISAGDGLAKFLGDCDNVTLMGTTVGGGVNQNSGGLIFITENISIEYPAVLSLSPEGEPFVDTDETRECRVPLDVHIPFTKDTALKMFSESEDNDTELDYAVRYLEEEMFGK